MHINHKISDHHFPIPFELTPDFVFSGPGKFSVKGDLGPAAGVWGSRIKLLGMAVQETLRVLRANGAVTHRAHVRLKINHRLTMVGQSKQKHGMDAAVQRSRLRDELRSHRGVSVDLPDRCRRGRQLDRRIFRRVSYGDSHRESKRLIAQTGREIVRENHVVTRARKVVINLQRAIRPRNGMHLIEIRQVGRDDRHVHRMLMHDRQIFQKHAGLHGCKNQSRLKTVIAARQTGPKIGSGGELPLHHHFQIEGRVMQHHADAALNGDKLHAAHRTHAARIV